MDGAILTTWLVTVGLVVVHEHGLGGRVVHLPRTIAVSLQAKEQWFGIYFQGRKVGFAQTMLAPEERNGVPGFSLVDHGRLHLSLLGQPHTVEIRADVFVDADYQLREFHATLHTPAYQIDFTGRRLGDELRWTMTTPTSTTTQRLHDPAGRLWISALSSWAAFQQLEIGQRGQVWLFNPLALQPESVAFRVTRKDVLDGQETLVIESDYRGIQAMTWITPEGTVLKESSPLGWELVQESMEDAIQVEAGSIEPIDVLSTTAVPIDRPLPDPDRLQRLTLLVEGKGAEAFRIDRRPWQVVADDDPLVDEARRTQAGAWCVIRLRRPLRDRPADSPPVGSPPSRYTAPSPVIQSDDPQIRRQAQEIIGSLRDPWAQAVAINHWTHRSLRKQLTIGLPTATDVLRSKAGDCHEHTVLLTALARSVGIPTRMVAGLVYYADRFYYHAWPEVWQDGVWMPMDPTLGQLVADPTHLGLVEAEGEELVSLAQFVGQLRLRVLEVEAKNAEGEEGWIGGKKEEKGR